MVSPRRVSKFELVFELYSIRVDEYSLTTDEK